MNLEYLEKMKVKNLKMLNKMEDKYCENCFNDDLDKYITDKFGGIYCDNECMEQSWIDKNEECINNDLYEKLN